MPHDESQLGWFHDHLPAYVAGGLSADERATIEHLAQGDDACRTELEELMALDASLHQSAGVSAIVNGLEERILAALPGRRWSRPSPPSVIFASSLIWAPPSIAVPRIYCNLP